MFNYKIIIFQGFPVFQNHFGNLYFYQTVRKFIIEITKSREKKISKVLNLNVTFTIISCVHKLRN